ncbi:hypothetical protein YC2023_101012 [Brassica napus]
MLSMCDFIYVHDGNTLFNSTKFFNFHQSCNGSILHAVGVSYAAFHDVMGLIGPSVPSGCNSLSNQYVDHYIILFQDVNHYQTSPWTNTLSYFVVIRQLFDVGDEVEIKEDKMYVDELKLMIALFIGMDKWRQQLSNFGLCDKLLKNNSQSELPAWKMEDII